MQVRLQITVSDDDMTRKGAELVSDFIEYDVCIPDNSEDVTCADLLRQIECGVNQSVEDFEQDNA